jgi:transposase
VIIIQPVAANHPGSLGAEMIDLKSETLLSLPEAAERLGVTLKTIYVWANRTDRRLETAKLGGKRYTSLEAIQRFSVQNEEPQDRGTILPTGLDRGSALQQLRALESM